MLSERHWNSHYDRSIIVDLRAAALRAVRQYIAAVLSHPVCGSWLRLPLETNGINFFPHQWG